MSTEGATARIPEGPLSKQDRLREILLEAIDEGLFPDTPIPSERDLMVRYGVSRATVRAAIGMLVSEGRLYRIHGRGTFVGRGRVESQLHLASFTDDMRRRGLDPATLVEKVGLEIPPTHARAALGLEAGENAWRVERLRLAGGAPMALETGWLVASLLPGLDRQDLTHSLYDLLAAEYGLVLDAGEQTVWAEVADPVLAQRLEVPRGTPLMVFRRTSTASGKAVEHVTSWYRGDRYQVHMTLERQPR
ncbi:MAG: GntR family transcriptional regulator, N-acetylglucosamine utilization regulator [Actinomycetota bacterium]|nr:GntR family transcriptional regulator, N-acetylglucosamine utilization regulator [Actinomycetota bacterium]